MPPRTLLSRRSLLALAMAFTGGCTRSFGTLLAVLPLGARALALDGAHVVVIGGTSQGFLWRIPRGGGEPHALHDRLVEPRDVAVHQGQIYVATDEGIVRQSIHGTQPEIVLDGEVRWVCAGASGVVWARRDGVIGVLGERGEVELGAEVAGLAAGAVIWATTPEETLRIERGRVAERRPMAAAGSIVVADPPIVATPAGIVRGDERLVETAAPAGLVGSPEGLAWCDVRGLGHWRPGAGARWLEGARAQALGLEEEGVVWVEAKTRKVWRTPLEHFH